jgi:peroxiredoxin
MNKRNIIILAGLCLLLGAVGCDSSRAGEQTQTEFVDQGYRGSIEEFDLDAYKGRVLILNFWATWCGPCRVEIPDLVRLRQDFAAQDLGIVGVSLDSRGGPGELQAALEKFVTRYKINYPIYLDARQQFAGAYDPGAEHMRYVPTTVIIDQSGKIFDTHFGVPRNSSGQVDPYGVIGAQVQELLDGA